MFNETQLLQDIRDAENIIRETLENLSKKYESYVFYMASTQDEFKQLGISNEIRYTVDISCHLRKD